MFYKGDNSCHFLFGYSTYEAPTENGAHGERMISFHCRPLFRGRQNYLNRKTVCQFPLMYIPMYYSAKRKPVCARTYVLDDYGYRQLRRTEKGCELPHRTWSLPTLTQFYEIIPTKVLQVPVNKQRLVHRQLVANGFTVKPRDSFYSVFR